MADTVPSSNLPQADPAPETTGVRCSSRLKAKRPTVEPQNLHRSGHTQTSPASKNENQNAPCNQMTSISEDEAARLSVAADVLLRLIHFRPGREMYGPLPDPVVSPVSTWPSGTPTQQSDEKENVAASLLKTTTGATQVTATTTTTSLNGQPLKFKKKNSKHTHSNAMKRKAAEADAPETTGSVPNAQKTKLRAVKRIRTKFVAEPSDRVTRSSKAEEDREGTGVNRIHAQQDGPTEQVTAAISIHNNNGIVKSNSESHDSSTDPAVDSKGLNDTSDKRRRLALIIPSRAASAAIDNTTTAVATNGVESGPTTTTNYNTPAVESAAVVTEAEVKSKALDSVDKEPSTAPKIRAPGWQHTNANA